MSANRWRRALAAGGRPALAQHRAADRANQDRLRRMQYRPGLLDGFLAKTGLDLNNPRY